MMKKLLLLVALLLAACLLCPRALAAESIEEMVAQAKYGVVQIYMVAYQNGRPTGSGGSGTGFAVGRTGEDSNVFVTNWHVVTGAGDFDSSQVKLYIALDNSSFEDAVYETDRVVPCEVLYITQGNPDLAILQATQSVSGFKALPLLPSDGIMDAAHVTALGYPGVLDDLTATHGGVDDMSVTQGYIVRHAVGDMPKAAGTKLLFCDAVISGGNSGGPLLSDAGAVVGINTYGCGETTSTDYSIAIYIDYAMEALDSLGLPYDVYDPAHAGASGFSPQVTALAAAGGVALAAGAAVAAQRRKSGAPAAVGAGAAAVRVEDSCPQEESAAGFILLGPMGQSTPVSASGLVIGRDPAQCTLCLPGMTRGVSRRHCQVTLSGSLLLLTDLGSSYGTFINGKKLLPNQPVPLSRGGSFCLGSAAVTFTVH